MNWKKVFLAGVLMFLSTFALSEQVTIKVTISSQTMNVYVGDKLTHQWLVSTARRGYKTPLGEYTPYWLDKDHRSRIYKNAPMPYSLFFNRGYAIHGTTQVKEIGRPASHGCVRLLTENARTLFVLVEQHGKENTRIVIES